MPTARQVVLVAAASVGAALVIACGSAGKASNEPAAPAVAITTPAATPTAPATQPSSSAPPAQIAMPNEVGKNAAVALDELTKLGFTNVELGTVDGHAFVALPANWTVKEQSAKVGTLLAADTKIVLGCAKNS